MHDAAEVKALSVQHLQGNVSSYIGELCSELWAQKWQSIASNIPPKGQERIEGIDLECS
jgi:hypothetical protein